MDRLEKAKQLFLEALALHEKGDLERAARLYQEALALAPERPSVMNNLAAVYLKLKRYLEAKRLCERLLQIHPEDEGALVNLGACQIKLDSPEDALTSCDRALAVKPDFADALNNRGNALMELNRLEEAVASYERALAIKPDYADALNNLGNALVGLGREGEANACFRRAVTLEPDEAERHFRFGNALSAQHRWDEATAQFERALELNPASADAEFGLAGVRLFQQQFERGWPGYERRLEVEHYRRKYFRDSQASVLLYERLARWRGPGEAGVGDVAIWAEQGIGDQVLFSTLIPELIEAGVPFVYEVDHRLLAAYERAFPGARFVAKEDPPQEALQRARYALAIGSLPGLFRRSREDFARQPAKLLSALPERAAYYRHRLDALEPGLKVALSWRSTRKDWWVTKKSAPLADFTPLLKLAGVRFVDVQYGDTAAERNAVEAAAGVRLTRFDEVDHLAELEEVLAILEACDLLITSSNATAHFAGALGKRTWLLYPADQGPFHYWAHDGSHRSLWYPSVEIVTGKQFTEWESLIRHAAEKLAHEKSGN